MTNYKEIIVTKETAGFPPVGIPPFSFRMLNAINWTQCESSWREKNTYARKKVVTSVLYVLCKRNVNADSQLLLIINCITHSIGFNWIAENVSRIGKRNYN